MQNLKFRKKVYANCVEAKKHMLCSENIMYAHRLPVVLKFEFSRIEF